MSSFENDYNAALSAAGAKPRAKKVYVRTAKAVYELSPKAAEKVVFDYSWRDPDATLSRHGKKLFVPWQGSWAKWPIERITQADTVKVDTPEGNIIHYLAIDAKDIQTHAGLKALIAERQHPKKNDMRHYKAMLATSKKVGWPKSFATDFTKHDKRDLTFRDPDLPAGWILREGGTQLVFPENTVSITNNRAALPSAWLKIMEGSYGLASCKFYVWDGTALISKSPEGWAEWMDGKHRKMLRGED